MLSPTGSGMRLGPEISYRFFRALTEAGIPISLTSTSDFKLSVLTRSELLDAAVLAIRRTFGWKIRRRGATTPSSDVMVGVGGFVHYGVTMQDGSVLDADAFLMKSSEVPAGAATAATLPGKSRFPAATGVS
ncbi:ACT domain-containing protein [Arthrobacter sp. VKM Ac-2550]|uniref:ACT domain-containing protein n=1 Tax=Crystallibacter permensis TaxID=1938888 RepID=UPI0022273165|nr:hypothetical protein [Arthrobacter sp. VKM Ac-2550]